MGGYFVLTENAPEIDDLFLSLYFERVRVPEFIHGTPEAALERLREQIARNRDALAQTKSSSRMWWAKTTRNLRASIRGSGFCRIRLSCGASCPCCGANISTCFI